MRAVMIAATSLLLTMVAALVTPRAAAVAVAVEPGLVVVSAINDAVMQKDYEAVLRIQSVAAEGVRSTMDWAIPDREAPDGVRRQTAVSLQRAQDGEHARRLILWHQPGDPETIPGATGPSPSAAVFGEIRTTGEASVVVGAVSKSDGQGLGMLGGLFAGRKYFRGVIKKLAAQPVRVLLDGTPTNLDTLHAGGSLSVADDRGDVEFWWLDDPASRLGLKFTFQGSTSQVVRIDRPKDFDRIQNALAGQPCRSEVPGIYFLTDSAELLPASQPTIQRVASVLKANASWTITIEGHTDATGSAQHNLDLSKRRADALKTALVTGYGIPAERLQTAGYGRTRPVETNETLEGRAHNRRVEILRRC